MADAASGGTSAVAIAAPILPAPTKNALVPGSAGINTSDVIAVQRYYLGLGTLACPDCGDVTGNGRVDTSDVVAIQRFFLGYATGIANVGKYNFNPASRSYPGVTANQIHQNYDALVIGDTASSFVHRVDSGNQGLKSGRADIRH
mgnify:CR=1 FL=1